MGTDRHHDLANLLAAVRGGQLTPNSARRWARRAAAGESTALVVRLAHGVQPPPESAVTVLASDLAAILATGSSTDAGAQAAAPELTDAEADQLWPPRTEAEAAARQHQVAAAASHAAALSDDQMIDVLFGPPGTPGR